MGKIQLLKNTFFNIFTTPEKKFLTGPQTKAGEIILQTTSLFGQSSLSKVYDAVSVVGALEMKRKNWSKNFVARSAEQILSDGYVCGCIDRAIVFIGLLQAQGVPARLVETIHIETLQGRVNRTGHAFVEFFEKDYGWKVIDPRTGEIFSDFYKQTGFIHLQTMPDFWSIGINNHRDFIQRFDDLSNRTKIPNF